MVTEAVLKIKESKACDPSGILIEIVKAGCDVMLDVISDLINLIINKEQIADDWDQSIMIELWWSLRKLGVNVLSV